MAVEVVTREDLQALRLQLLSDIQQLFRESELKVQKRWLKNSDVRKLLGISANTVQRLRVVGKLQSS